MLSDGKEVFVAGEIVVAEELLEPEYEGAAPARAVMPKMRGIDSIANVSETNINTQEVPKEGKE